MSSKKKIGLISGAFAAILITFTFLGWGWHKSNEYEQHAYTQSADFAEYMDRETAQNCLNLSAQDKRRCLAETQQTKRQYERQEYDLAAQRQSALWAYIMGAAAVIGMALSVLGVVLVYSTFHETKEGNKIARDSLAIENRAWIKVEICSVGDWKFYPSPNAQVPDTYVLPVSFRLENIGSSAALDTFTINFFNIHHNEINLNRGAIKQKMEAYKRGVRRTRSAHMLAGEIRNFDIHLQVDATEIVTELRQRTEPIHYGIYIVICAQYKTIFDQPNDEPRQTCFVAELVRRLPSQPKNAGVIIAADYIPADQLFVEPPAYEIGHVT